MGYTYETWGLFSVNKETYSKFCYDTDPWFGPEKLNAIFRIRNLTLRILGYLPYRLCNERIAMAFGLVRIGSAIPLWIISHYMGTAMVKSNSNSEHGCIATTAPAALRNQAIAQMVRGILEMIPYYGWRVNAILDVLGSIANGREISMSKKDNETFVCWINRLFMWA